MAIDKTHKIPNAPNLRFPEFEREWGSYTLGEICSEFQSGKNIKADSIMSEGSIPVYGGNGLRGYTDSWNHQGEYVLIGRQGALCGNVKYVSGDTYITEHAIAVKASESNNTKFLQYLFERMDLGRYSDQSAQPGLAVNKLLKLKARIPHLNEQIKIADFFALLDSRITTQIGAIEDYKKLKGYLIDELIEQRGRTMKIGDVIAQRTERNRKNDDYTVLSVNNQKGFIAQSEQFEEREVASEDKSNYKIVRRDDFAYNPARINVGSIARLSNYDCGIVSPMYICFHSDERVLPEFLGYFFESRYFATEVDKRLEGSVRLCLSYDGLCDISIQIPNVENQQAIIQKLDAVSQKIALEEQCLDLFKQQKAYLLKNMFV